MTPSKEQLISSELKTLSIFQSFVKKQKDSGEIDFSLYSIFFQEILNDFNLILEPSNTFQKYFS